MRLQPDLQFAAWQQEVGYGSEGKARLDVFKQCPIGRFHLTDLEGVYIDCQSEA